MTSYPAQRTFTPVKTAYSFVRWSTSRQSKESSDSKRRQLKSAEDWCRDNGYTLSKQVFIGANESGYKAKHLKVKDGVAIGALARFIEAVENGDVKSQSVLCIDSVDRFSRQEILDALEPFTRLLNLGIGIVFTGSPLKPLLTRELINKEPHWLEFVIRDMVRSWMESAEKSRKIIAAKKRKRDEIQSGKPVPHNNAPKYFTWNASKGEYEHNKKTLVVKRLVKMFLAGNTLYFIARTLNAEKIPTVKTDSAWSANAVRSIIKNRTMLGEFLGAKKFFPPILQPETFDRVQALLAQNPSFNKGKPGTLANVFRGIAYCTCNRRMCVLSQTKDPHTKKPHSDPFRYRYLRCNSQGTGKNCEHTFVMPLRDMEEEFFGNFLLQDPKELVADKAEAKELNGDIAKTQLAISALDKSINDAAELIGSGVAVNVIKSKLTKLESQRAEKQGQLDRLTAKANQIQTAPGHFDDLKKLVHAFDTEPHGATWLGKDLKLHLSPKAKAFDVAIERMNKTLRDNEVRKKIKSMLPILVGRIEVNSYLRTWQVFNHSGKCIYKSLSHEVR